MALNKNWRNKYLSNFGLAEQLQNQNERQQICTHIGRVHVIIQQV